MVVVVVVLSLMQFTEVAKCLSALVICRDLNFVSGDVVAQLVERRPRDPMDSMTRGSNQSRPKHKKNLREFFRVIMLC